MKPRNNNQNGEDFFDEVEDEVFSREVKKKSGFKLLNLVVILLVFGGIFAIGRLFVARLFSSPSLNEAAKNVVSKHSGLSGFFGGAKQNEQQEVEFTDTEKMDDIKNLSNDNVDGVRVASEKFETVNILGNVPKWDTGALYSSINDSKIESDLQKLGKMSREFSDKYVAADISHGSVLLEGLREYGEISDLSAKLGSYVAMSMSVNKKDPAIAKIASKIHGKIADSEGQLVFFPLLLGGITEDQLHVAMAETPALEEYSYYIKRKMEFKKHFLPQDVEKYAAKKSLTADVAWVNLFDKTLAKIRVKTTEGDQLTIAETLDKIRTADSDLRHELGSAMGRALKENSDVLGAAFNAVVRNWIIEAEARHFDSTISMRNFANDIQDNMVSSLIDTVKSRYGVAHKYYKLKARLMGVRRLKYSDRLAKYDFEKEKKISWSEATNEVISSYRAFSPKMSSIVEDLIKKNAIDAAPSGDKDSGAYCISPSVKTHPFVEMSYLGSERDVFTLAHELGHAIHGVLAANDGTMSPLLYHPPLTLAEVSSMFGEKLLFDSLISREKDPVGRAALLATSIEDAINAIVRQCAFADFERRIFKSSAESDLGVEEISKIWLDVQEEYLGDVFIFEEYDKYYWGYVSHFIHSPYYVYAYAFAQALVDNLHNVYKSGKVEGFEDKFMTLLASGGSKNYIDALSPLSVNLSDSRFWEMAMDEIEKMIEELDQLVRSEKFLEAMKTSGAEVKIGSGHNASPSQFGHNNANSSSSLLSARGSFGDN